MIGHTLNLRCFAWFNLGSVVPIKYIAKVLLKLTDLWIVHEGYYMRLAMFL